LRVEEEVRLETDLVTPAVAPLVLDTDLKDKENSNTSQHSQLSWKHYIEQEPDP
jgi:hypothetical protein